MRVFAALVPSDDAVEHLQEFLAPRQDAADPAWRWSRPYQWHATLAFAEDLPDYLIDDVADRVAGAAAKRSLPELAIAGGGAFPDPDRAKVLWAGLRAADGQEADGNEAIRRESGGDAAAEELARLAAGCRAAFATAGVAVDGARFRAHVTLARLRRPGSVTRWVRLLDAYSGPAWPAAEVALICSYLGEGPRRAPRYEVLATCPLGR